jgi:hypothetical protein
MGVAILLSLSWNPQQSFQDIHCPRRCFQYAKYVRTTEEVFNYFDFEVLTGEKDNAVAQKAYNQFNPINYVDKWNTPILIIQGGKDFVYQSDRQEAFQAARFVG